MQIELLYFSTGVLPIAGAVNLAVHKRPPAARRLCEYVLTLASAEAIFVARTYADTCRVGACGRQLRELAQFVIADVHRDEGFEQAWASLFDASSWPARAFMYNFLRTEHGPSKFFETKAEAQSDALEPGAAAIRRYYLSPDIGFV